MPTDTVRDESVCRLNNLWCAFYGPALLPKPSELPVGLMTETVIAKCAYACTPHLAPGGFPLCLHGD